MADVAQGFAMFVVGLQQQLIQSRVVLPDGNGAHPVSGTSTRYVPVVQVVEIRLADPRAA